MVLSNTSVNGFFFFFCFCLWFCVNDTTVGDRTHMGGFILAAARRADSVRSRWAAPAGVVSFYLIFQCFMSKSKHTNYNKVSINGNHQDFGFPVSLWLYPDLRAPPRWKTLSDFTGSLALFDLLRVTEQGAVSQSIWWVYMCQCCHGYWSRTDRLGYSGSRLTASGPESHTIKRGVSWTGNSLTLRRVWFT